MSLLSRLGLVATAIVSSILAAGVRLANAAQAGVWQYWDYPPLSGGYYNADQNVTVARTGTTRFFAHQIWFIGGDAAYIGIQDNPNGTLAIFSVWNSPGNASPGSPGSYCVAFGGEGVGYSCRIPYA